MSINFPTSTDSLANPTAGELLENAVAGLDHDTQHSNANDAIEALEAKVGVNSSAVTTSHDYKLGEVTSTDKAVGKTATQTLTNKTLTSPILNLSSNATGDTYFRKSDGTLERLPIGTLANIISVSAGGVPEWVANPSSILKVDTQTFTGSGTYTKPTTGTPLKVLVQMWGAGGSGGRGAASASAGGGGGGAYVEHWFDIASVGATETVTIGAGGAARTSNVSGVAGGNSTFGSLVTAYGGGGGNAGTGGGGGGGAKSVGLEGETTNGGNGGSPIPAVGGVGDGPTSVYGGGAGGGNSAGGESVYGGGGGGGGANGGGGGVGGNSYYGGGGGGGANVDSSPGGGAGGTSTFGGAGGAGAYDANNATAGSVPSGGGGGSELGNSGGGGNGKIIVTTFIA